MKHFEELLSKLPAKDYIGLGNPQAKILFIGKEPGVEIETQIYHGSTESWKDRKNDYSKRYIPTESNLRNLNHTWQNYQKLYEMIMLSLDTENYIPKSEKYEITFVENVFTTELSRLPAKRSDEAKAQSKFVSELEKRKQNFFNSEFVKGFSIIIIFASDNKYIETYPGEVCNLFNVEFDHLYNYPGKDKIWIHYGNTIDNNPKLLIHTRQLINSFSPDLIPSLSDVISSFIKSNQLLLKEI